MYLNVDSCTDGKPIYMLLRLFATVDRSVGLLRVASLRHFLSGRAKRL
jgi:hypothetical protein